jgi:site-specific DNA-adenine methylase
VAGRDFKRFLPWFGSDAAIAEIVGKLSHGCNWAGVPCAGGMTALLHIQCPTMVVSDIHRHAINLAVVVQSDELFSSFYKQVDSVLFHPDMLKACQAVAGSCTPSTGNAQAAACYYIAAWMGRSHSAGTDTEFNGRLSTRWNGNGGDSCKRYRSAVKSLWLWRQVFRRCNFEILDVFEFLDKIDDDDKKFIYIDPPFPDKGHEYKHKFTEAMHRKLAQLLTEKYVKTRVVCRFYGDHHLVKEIYPKPHWRWLSLSGRKQTNEEAPEVLLINQDYEHLLAEAEPEKTPKKTRKKKTA